MNAPAPLTNLPATVTIHRRDDGTIRIESAGQSILVTEENRAALLILLAGIDAHPEPLPEKGLLFVSGLVTIDVGRNGDAYEQIEEQEWPYPTICIPTLEIGVVVEGLRP